MLPIERKLFYYDEHIIKKVEDFNFHQEKGIKIFFADKTLLIRIMKFIFT